MNLLVEGVLQDTMIANQFFSNYFVTIIQATLNVMTDQLHMTGFEMQAKILQKLFYTIETN